MTETAEVVVIGGGVIGSSIAYHLAERGSTKTLVLERASRPGEGSTGKATGGVRAQFATDINIRMSLYSIEFLARFRDATGHASGYKPAGYLFLATTPEQFDYLRRVRERQLAAGLKDVELVSAETAARMLPQLSVEDVAGGSFCATDGFISPLDVMHGFMSRAREGGARLSCETEVTGIELDARGIAGVTTTRGRISTRTVVSAAGAWAAEVARLAGVEVPVVPLRRQIVATEPSTALPPEFPMVIDMSDGFHFRPRLAEGRPTGGALLAWPDPSETPGFREGVEPSFVGKILRRAARRVPALASARADHQHSRSGLYEMTPDHHAIIGRAPGIEGLFLANGFSGHGVMHSPAAGRIVADLILDGRCELFDSAALGLERFAEGKTIEETVVL
jgi:sarcosine oxidase subunit beta